VERLNRNRSKENDILFSKDEETKKKIKNKNNLQPKIFDGSKRKATGTRTMKV
jgi:hypothetical protein